MSTAGWSVADGEVTYRFATPPGTRALLRLPAGASGIAIDSNSLTAEEAATACGEGLPVGLAGEAHERRRDLGRRTDAGPVARARHVLVSTQELANALVDGPRRLGLGGRRATGAATRGDDRDERAQRQSEPPTSAEGGRR